MQAEISKDHGGARSDLRRIGAAKAGAGGVSRSALPKAAPHEIAARIREGYRRDAVP